MYILKFTVFKVLQNVDYTVINNDNYLFFTCKNLQSTFFNNLKPVNFNV